MALKETKEAVQFGIDLMEGIADAAHDQKWSPSDLTDFLKLIKDAPAAIDGMSLIPEEIKTAKPEEWAELLAWAEKEFDIPQTMIELKVEAALRLMAGFCEAWQQWPKPAAPTVTGATTT